MLIVVIFTSYDNIYKVFELPATLKNDNDSGELKEQYPVTAHAPNFERCEESKRILKNPFASRLAGFNTTLKLLRIIDQ